MRANLKNGRLIPPRNVERGLARLKQLHHEIKKFPLPLAMPPAALKNLKLLKAEEHALVEWLIDHGVAPSMIVRKAVLPTVEEENTTRFRVSFTVEVAHFGDKPDNEIVEGAVTDLVDFARDKSGGDFESHGIKITDTFGFGAEVE